MTNTKVIFHYLVNLKLLYCFEKPATSVVKIKKTMQLTALSFSNLINSKLNILDFGLQDLLKHFYLFHLME